MEVTAWMSNYILHKTMKTVRYPYIDLNWTMAIKSRRSHPENHYDDVIMSAIASQITSLTIVYSTDFPDADQSKHQSSASLAFVWGIHRGPVNSPHKWPVTRKMFPFDDVIMIKSMGKCQRNDPVVTQWLSFFCINTLTHLSPASNKISIKYRENRRQNLLVSV